MNTDVFTQGTAPGALTNEYEIKILICYLLKNVTAPLSAYQMNEIFQEYSIVNYFEFASALADLRESGHIVASAGEEGTEVFTITELGTRTADTLESSLPRAVRDKAVCGALALLAKERLNRENTVDIDRTEDGYLVTCTVSDVGSDLMQLKLFVPDELQAQAVKREFSKRPQSVYARILSLLTQPEEE